MRAVKNPTVVRSINGTTAQQKGLDTWFSKQAEKFEATRLGWMAIYITVQSCLGSIAAMYLLEANANDLVLALCAMVTMAANAIFIAQGPAKWCLASFYISVLINTGLILTYL